MGRSSSTDTMMYIAGGQPATNVPAGTSFQIVESHGRWSWGCGDAFHCDTMPSFLIGHLDDQVYSQTVKSFNEWYREETRVGYAVASLGPIVTVIGFAFFLVNFSLSDDFDMTYTIIGTVLFIVGAILMTGGRRMIFRGKHCLIGRISERCAELSLNSAVVWTPDLGFYNVGHYVPGQIFINVTLVSGHPPPPAEFSHIQMQPTGYHATQPIGGAPPPAYVPSSAPSANAPPKTTADPVPCSSCGQHTILAAAKFCPSCGSKQPDDVLQA